MTSLRTTQRAALAAALTIVLAACAGGGASPAAPSVSVAPPSAAPAASPTMMASASAAASMAPSAAASASAGAASGGPSAVTIQGYAFGPSTLTVAVGTTVTWTNQDAVKHTVTANDGSFDGGPLSNGQTFSQTFAKAGTYAYHCKIHPSMTATITVH